MTFAQEPPELAGITAAHNLVRQNLNDGLPPVAGEPVQPVPVPPLQNFVWDVTVAAAAQAWSDNCVWAHSNNSLYGENIYATSGSATPDDVVGSWSGEASDYNYVDHTCAGVCGHYTQVVWSTSVDLGCGVTNCTTGSPFGGGNWQFWVCNYSPPGNFPVRPYCTATQTTECEMGPPPGDPTLTVVKNGTGNGTVTGNPAGIDCGATCSAQYTAGTVITLTAAADTGSSFEGWTGGGCSGTGSCSVTLTSSTTVTATFNTVGGSCSGAATLTCDMPLNGTSVGATPDFNGYSCAAFQQAGTDRVYELVAATDGTVTVDLTNPTEDFDLFVLGSCDPMSCLDNSESEGFLDEQVSFEAIGGQTYYIVVEDYFSAGGTFTLNASCSSSSSAGGVSNLLMDKSGPDLLLSWNADCGRGDTYGVYRGDLSQGYGSIAVDTCGVANTNLAIQMGTADGEFFLIVPAWGAQEGSYGSFTGGERTSALGSCYPRGPVDQCAQ